MLVSFDKKTKAMFLIAFLAILVSISFSSYKYFFKKDYILYIHEACDPATEECLVKDCDAEEDPRCPYTGEFFYKEVHQNALDYRR